MSTGRVILINSTHPIHELPCALLTALSGPPRAARTRTSEDVPAKRQSDGPVTVRATAAWPRLRKVQRSAFRAESARLVAVMRARADASGR